MRRRSGLRGSQGPSGANDLVWSDKSSVENVQPLAVPPFDVDVDFETTGDGTLPSATPALP